MTRKADMGGVRWLFPANLREVRGPPERHVPIACDIIRLMGGRTGPVASSLMGLSKADIARIQSAANAIAGECSEVAGIGFELKSGLHVILRRMPHGQEVRGLITRQDYAATDAIRLLGNHPFWASGNFTARRQAQAPLEPGHSPSRWAHGLAVLPRGFVWLAGGDAPPSASPAPRAEVRREATSLVDVARTSQGVLSDQREPAPPWVLQACVAATAVSALFLATAIVLSQLGRPPDVPPTPLAPPLPTPSP